MFEQELQQLVTKYNLRDVEVSFKRTITLSANLQPNENIPKPFETAAGLSDEIDPSEELAARYAGGPIGRIAS